MAKSLQEMLLQMMGGNQKGFNIPITKAPESTQTYLDSVDYSQILGRYAGGQEVAGQALGNNLIGGLLKLIMPIVNRTEFSTIDDERVTDEEHQQYEDEATAEWIENQENWHPPSSDISLPGQYELNIDWDAIAAGDAPNPFSDIRLKENIELVGNSPSGVNIYEFDYKNKIYGNGRYRGVMAQEVPDSSFKASNGYLMVDYSNLDVKFKRIR
jgi:hypothetical protein